MINLPDHLLSFYKSKRTLVPPVGPVSECKIACIAEQPGKHEILGRPPRPLIGPAGEELDKCFIPVGILRPEVYLTNVIKDLDKPLQHYIDLTGRSPVVSADGQMYLHILRHELSQCSANVFVAMGNVALFALTGRTGVTRWRGSIIESTLLPGRKVVPMRHPAQMIKWTMRGVSDRYSPVARYYAVFDLKRAKEESLFPEIRRAERNIKIQPSFYEATYFLTECIVKGKQGTPIAYDIELSNMEVSCISFAFSPTVVMSIPFIGSGGDYFSPEQEVELWKLIAQLLEDPTILKIGQNLSFDSHFLLRKYGISSQNMKDSMIGFHTLICNLKKDLGTINSLYTDHPYYYKDDGKFWLKGIGSWENGWIYNALDSAIVAEDLPKIQQDLEKQGNLDAYNRQCALIPPLTYMQERGIKVDIEGVKKAEANYHNDIAAMEIELTTIAGRYINYHSHVDVKNYFYHERKLPAYTKVAKTGKKQGLKVETVDNDALKRIIRKGFREAKLIQQLRTWSKKASTYLEVEKVDADSRLRCAFNPAGTAFSRLSSSANIFGTGMNMQNWPHDLLRYLLFDEGYMGYWLDLSQAENRIVAYVGNVIQMIMAFEHEMDVHSMTASLILGKPIKEISREAGSSSLGNGDGSERDWGKKANHALNYGYGYKSFALKYELPESDAKWIVERYHMAYPGVRQNYHVMIQQMLHKNKTITNLMGRKTLFVGDISEKVTKSAYSCIPQGSVGDIINEYGILFLWKSQDKYGPVEMLNQVHDSLVFQIPLNLPWEYHAQVLLDLKKSLEIPLTWEDRTFVIPVDFGQGFNMRKEEGIEYSHKNFPTNVHQLANKLWEGYCHLKCKDIGK